MLALKDNTSAMNRAGLGTQGVVGSQVNSINNNYGTNLTELLKGKQSDLNNLEIQKNDTNTSYDTNRINLLNEYGTNLANLRSEIDDKALSQYNTEYNQYLALKQQEYENEQAEKAAAEAIRQYNETLAYQKALAAQEQKNWEKEYALSKYATYSKSSSGTFENTFDENSKVETTENGLFINPFTKTVNTDAKNGVFSNGYQPDNINGKKLKKSGKTVSQFTGESGNLNSGNASIDNQNVWKLNGRYYAWDGYQNKYVDITSRKKSTVKKASSTSSNSSMPYYTNTITSPKIK